MSTRSFTPGSVSTPLTSRCAGMPRRLAAVLAPAALLLSLLGCHQTPEQIGSTVRDSMQQTFDKDPNFAALHFHVEKVVPVKHSDTDYDGTATVDFQGKPHDVPVHITLTKGQVDWKTDPGALDFAQ